MSRELFESYLQDQTRFGPVPDRAFTGAAGGAACGDLARVSLLLDEGRIASVTADAEGCGATRAATAAVAEMVDGEAVVDAARIGTDEVDAAIGGLTPAKRHAAQLAADALHRALARAAASGERLAAQSPGRVADRDVGRGGQRRRRPARTRARGGRARRHPQALGRPGDRRRQGLLLAGGGSRRPRRGPLDRRSAPHPRPRGGVPPPRRRRLPRRLRRRRHAEPVHRLQRRGADRGDDRPRRAARCRAPGHRPLRADRRRRRRPAARRGRRPGEGPELHARRAAAAVAGTAALPADRADQAAGARDRRPPRPLGRPQAREPGPLLPRRPGKVDVPAPPRRPAGARRRRARPLRPGGRPPPRPPQLHGRPATRDRRLGRRAALRASPPTPPPTPSPSAPAPTWRRRGSGSATRSCTATADSVDCGPAALPRSGRAGLGPARRRRPPRSSSTSSCGSPSTPPLRDRRRCCCPERRSSATAPSPEAA